MAATFLAPRRYPGHYMAGATRRSKACRTCRKRRIACTLERPHCQTCMKTKRECLGYDEVRTLISDDRTRTIVPKVETFAGIDGLAGKGQAIDHLQGTIPAKNAYSFLWSISSPSTRSAYREQIFSEILYSYTRTSKSSAASPPLTESWFHLLSSHPVFTTALEATVLAVCIARLGRINNDSALVHESRKFYTQGLCELQRALYTPDLKYRDETAASCMTLIAYEVAECPNQTVNGWKRHIQGCAKLFEIRGPRAYSSKMGHRIFLAFRQLEIQQAFLEKRSTFLSSPEWTTYPWMGHTKPLSHILLDVQADIASSLASRYALLSAPVANPLSLLKQLLTLIHRSWELDARLQDFYRQLQGESSEPLYWPRLSNRYNKPIELQGAEEEGEIFPVSFHFKDIDTCLNCMRYWATLAILWSGMKFSYTLLSSLKSSSLAAVSEISSQIPPLEHRADVAAMAKNICQSVEYLIAENSQTSSGRAMFPLKVAVEALGDLRDSGCEREFEWAKGVIGKIAGRGARIMRHLDRPIEQHAFIPSPGKKAVNFSSNQDLICTDRPLDDN